MKRILIIFVGFLAYFVNSVCADECIEEHDVNTATKPLHHIIEFGKRSNVFKKGCVKKKSANSSSVVILGFHSLSQARSQQKPEHNVTKVKDTFSSLKNITFENPKHESGSKRTSGVLHRLQLRAETISMLHKIVEKYFPGGHLTVDQKIKALKILGKLLKLKKEGKNSDIKKLLDTLSVHNRKSSPADEKVKEVENENSKPDEGIVDDGDIYANIASGPDVPKLPPAVDAKDSEHTLSNIMPTGFQPLRGAGDVADTLTHPNDISDDMKDSPNDRLSNYQAPLGNEQAGMGLGQIYRNGNNFLQNGISLSSMPSAMDLQGYARSLMPYPRRSHRGYRPRYYEDDDDEDDDDVEGDGGDDDNDVDDDDDDDEEQSRARSYVNRHPFYEDDDDDADADDVTTYSRRFDRKDKIAKSPKKSIPEHLHHKNLKVPHLVPTFKVGSSTSSMQKENK